MKGLPIWAEKEAPDSEDLLSAESLEMRLLDWPSVSFMAVGDVLLGDRSSKILRKKGPAYPFKYVRPLLQKSRIVLANLEGPFAQHALPHSRHYSYRADPRFAPALFEAGITIGNLANNHILDCGREGVIETFQIVREAGLLTIGAGLNREEAHLPVIQQAGPWRIGFLGYYWNRRCAATDRLPGSAMETEEDLARDIGQLKTLVDRVVVTFHWGIPYERDPLETDQRKARQAIDLGADVVIGHHPHVLQRYEIYRDRPIFYSLGNFAFGSGNSLAEGLLLSVRFDPAEIVCAIIPLYVKNRDPRVNFQPKVLAGKGGTAVLSLLKNLSGKNGDALQIQDGWGFLYLRQAFSDGCRSNARVISKKFDEQ